MTIKLTRRTLLASGFSAAVFTPLQRAQAEACTLAPEQALGPYYLADELLRSDIREGKAGVPLKLLLQVVDASTCQPLADAAVDVWHCDAAGAYSGFGGDSHRFLRGIQVTDRTGLVEFHTIFPGCYPGRTNHIHFQVRSAGAVAGETYRGGHIAHTGQVFFPEEITLPLMKGSAYAAQAAERMRPDQDGIFLHQGGAVSTAQCTPVAAADPSRGFEALLVAAVKVSD